MDAVQCFLEDQVLPIHQKFIQHRKNGERCGCGQPQAAEWKEMHLTRPRHRDLERRHIQDERNEPANGKNCRSDSKQFRGRFGPAQVFGAVVRNVLRSRLGVRHNWQERHVRFAAQVRPDYVADDHAFAEQRDPEEQTARNIRFRLRPYDMQRAHDQQRQAAEGLP